MIEHVNMDESNISQTWFGAGVEQATSFPVYEDKDTRRAGIMNFLSKVGSIQNLEKRESSPNEA